MRTQYSPTQVKKALTLIEKGYTRKQAAKAAKMNVFTVAYHQNKTHGKPMETRILLNKIKKVQTILSKATEALKTIY